MLTQDQGLTLINGVNVYDVIVVSQIIEKLLRGGLVTGKELGHVSTLRAKLHNLVLQSSGIDIDEATVITEKRKIDNE